MVEAVSSIQVYAFGFLVDGHDSQADVQRTMELPSLNLKYNNTNFRHFQLLPIQQTYTGLLGHTTINLKAAGKS